MDFTFLIDIQDNYPYKYNHTDTEAE